MRLAVFLQQPGPDRRRCQKRQAAIYPASSSDVYTKRLASSVRRDQPSAMDLRAAWESAESQAARSSPDSTQSLENSLVGS